MGKKVVKVSVARGKRETFIHIIETIEELGIWGKNGDAEASQNIRDPSGGKLYNAKSVKHSKLSCLDPKNFEKSQSVQKLSLIS